MLLDFLNLGTPELIMLALALLFPALCIYDISRSNYKNTNTRLLWILIILVGNFAGCIIYLLMGRKNSYLRA